MINIGKVKRKKNKQTVKRSRAMFNSLISHTHSRTEVKNFVVYSVTVILLLLLSGNWLECGSTLFRCIYLYLLRLTNQCLFSLSFPLAIPLFNDLEMWHGTLHLLRSINIPHYLRNYNIIFS